MKYLNYLLEIFLFCLFSLNFAKADVTWQKFDMDSLHGANTLKMCIDKQGNIWALGYYFPNNRPMYGINKWDGDKWNNIFPFGDTKLRKLISDSITINDILVDKNNNLWIATGGYLSGNYPGNPYGGAMIRFDGNSWTSISLPDSTFSDSSSYWRSYNNIACDSVGNIWVTTDVAIPYSVTYTVSGIYFIKESLAYELIEFNNNIFKIIKMQSSNYDYKTMYGFNIPVVTPEGYIWVTQINTDMSYLHKYDGNNWMQFKLKSQECDTLPLYVTDLIANNDNSLFITSKKYSFYNGTNNGGLAQFDGINWTFYNDYLPVYIGKYANKIYLYQYLNSICRDDNILWLGTIANGLIKLNLDNKKSEFFMPANYLHNINTSDTSYINTINDIKKDLKGNLWLGTKHGIIKISSNISINESNNCNQEFSISPDPVFDILSINNYLNECNYRIEIYNIFGQLILSCSFNKELDVSKFCAGVYYLRINNTVKKFVKL